MVYVYDLETLKNLITACFEDANSGETKEFVLFKGRFQLKELISFLKEKHLLIGYNVLKFDSQILQYILDNEWRWAYVEEEEVIEDIYKFSQKVIALTNNGDFPPYAEWKLYNRHLDIFTIWHFDNRAKATSLKWLQYMIDWHDLREMPIHHSSIVKEEEIEDILYYCRNDVSSTKALYWITKGVTDIELYKGIDKMQLREDVRKEFDFMESSLNWNDVKIGDQLNMKGYFKLTDYKKRDELYELKHKKSKRQSFTFGDCFPDYAEFKTDEFKEFIASIENEMVNIDEKQAFEFQYNQTTYTIAKGGAHSNDPKRIIVPKEDEILRDADIGSMYPNALRKRNIYPSHLGSEWNQIININIEKRLEAKKLYKDTGDKKYQNIQETYKLALNGGSFGKLNEKTSWQEDPFAAMKVTIGSQIDLLMLIESLELAGIPVISANTDGIVCLFKKELEETYYRVCKEWEVKVGNDTLGQLEYQDYTRLIQLSVNDYLAVKPDGKTKKKGDFMTDFELHKNKSYRIVPLALEAYFVDGEAPESFMRKHIGKEKAIFDFCKGVRAKSNSWFESRDVEVVQSSLFGLTSPQMTYSSVGNKEQKTIRYYISNKGKKLVKVYSDGRESQLDAGPWLATMFNIYKKENYDVNYDFYLDKVVAIIQQVEGGEKPKKKKGIKRK